jgi:hypothetical protein
MRERKITQIPQEKTLVDHISGPELQHCRSPIASTLDVRSGDGYGPKRHYD